MRKIVFKKKKENCNSRSEIKQKIKTKRRDLPTAHMTKPVWRRRGNGEVVEGEKGEESKVKASQQKTVIRLHSSETNTKSKKGMFQRRKKSWAQYQLYNISSTM